MTKYDEWVKKKIKREEELIDIKNKRELTPFECLEILEIHTTGRNYKTQKPYCRWRKEIKTIRKALEERIIKQ